MLKIINLLTKKKHWKLQSTGANGPGLCITPRRSMLMCTTKQVDYLQGYDECKTVRAALNAQACHVNEPYILCVTTSSVVALTAY